MRKGKKIQTIEFPYTDPQVEIYTIPERIEAPEWPTAPTEEPAIPVPAESPFGFPVRKKEEVKQ